MTVSAFGLKRCTTQAEALTRACVETLVAEGDDNVIDVAFGSCVARSSGFESNCDLRGAERRRPKR